MIGANLSMALSALARNRMRSTLTMLGVVIGVASVIALVTIGQSATEHVTGEVGRLGDNLLWVQPGEASRGSPVPAPPFRIADAEAIAREIGGVRAVSPSATRMERVVHQGRSWSTRVWGITDTFLDVRSYGIAAGRAFSPSELQAGAAVCLLGADVVKELFGAASPLGATVRIQRLGCRVVGVLASKGSSTLVDDHDDLVLVPLPMYHRRLAGNRDVSILFASARPGRANALVAHQIAALMRERRRIGPREKDDFRVRSLDEVSDTVGTITNVLTALLGAIAAVSLLVGGIGIMNIMLVSVTERTREIGIRLAIGARGRDVLLQFLVEAMALSSLGGLVGIALGLGGSWAATRAFDVRLVVLPPVVALAFVFSAFVGVAFGFLPARRAARLHPIEALRHE